jgi:hypothetical protein
VDLRTNSDYFPIQRQLTAFYNQERVFLLRGTDWMFKLVSTSQSNSRPILYSHATFRHVPVATTSIKEDNTTDPTIPPLEGVQLVMHTSLHFNKDLLYHADE